jgi:phage repressor protein C with HTH and peptisase S24 domain
MAAQVGVHRNTLTNWTDSAGADAPQLAKLAALGVDVLYVLTGQRNLMGLHASAMHLHEPEADYHRGLPSDARRIRVVVAGKQYTVNADDYRWVPVLDVRVAGGAGAAVLGENVVTFNAYRREWLAERGLLEADLSEVTITGKSMEPVLPEGKSVLVNHSMTDPQGGSIFVVRQDEDLIAKYVQKLPGGRLQISSENSQAFPTYEVTDDDIEAGKFAIIGCVVPR